MQQEGRTVRKCGNALKEISVTYETTENALTGKAGTSPSTDSQPARRDETLIEEFVNMIKKWIASIIKYYFIDRPSPLTVEPYEVDNIVFDKDSKDGRYGGDQGSLKNRDAEQKQWIYNNILKKNNPKLNLNSSELYSFYYNMNMTGCAYVALLNMTEETEGEQLIDMIERTWNTVLATEYSPQEITYMCRSIPEAPSLPENALVFRFSDTFPEGAADDIDWETEKEKEAVFYAVKKQYENLVNGKSDTYIYLMKD